MSRYVQVRDEVSWQQFGAPDPAFFDKYIKDTWLAVIGKAKQYYILQDPTDLESDFVVPGSLLIEPDYKRAS